MLLRDYLNEFELDWAAAPVRSELIPAGSLKGKKVLFVGDQAELQRAAAWSFLAWNDSSNAGICAEEAEWTEQGFCVGKVYSEKSFAPEEADYVILTGYCCRSVPGVLESAAYLQSFEKMAEAAVQLSCSRVLLLSDGRVYGSLEKGFAASEYEAGTTDPCADGYEAQYFMQALEGRLIRAARKAGKAFNILRTGMIYGAHLPVMEHPVTELAQKTARGEEIRVRLSQERTSYISIHDVLTAIQFVLTKTPANKIFNAAGPSSCASDGELAILLYNNFPNRCRITLSGGAEAASGRTEQARRTDQPGRPERAGQADETGRPEQTDETGRTEQGRKLSPGGIWLNTQLLEHYGFEPKISLEDGVIILVKSLMQAGAVFIFDNTYLGKLDKVQQILLGYMLEIDRICRKHNIKYFLAGGTLLGAIRHHGFIPWDDDADVMMLREDYDKFLKVVQQELPDNIFVQLPQTEKGNYNPFTKLRINNTMFATEFTGHFMEMHNGIFFDVLSHDRTGVHKWSQKLHLMATMLTRSIVFNKWGDTDIKGGGAHPIICKIVDRVKYLIPMRLALWAQNRSLTFFKNRKTGYLYDGMGRNLKRGSFPAEWLDEAVYVDFEGYQFPVPKEYDKYLTYLYGDYMQMIPVSQRRTSHSIVLMDLGEYSQYSLKPDTMSGGKAEDQPESDEKQ